MSEKVRVLNDLHVHGALVLPDDASGFPENPQLGTFVIKDRCLYGYLRIGSMETWYPFASKTQYFIHTQGLPATTWFVTHNLGTKNLWVQVKDENGNIVSVGKEDVSDNQFKLTFTTAVKGTALVVAPDSVDVPVLKASLIEVGTNVQIDSTGVRIGGSYALTSANIDQQIADAVAPKADTTYVDQRFTDLIGAAPAALDTLKEIADQINADETVADALAAAVALKADAAATTAALATKADDAALAAVAKTGAYADLSGKPVLGSAAALDVPVSGTASADQVVKGNDSRLSDARTPVAHSHSVGDVTGLQGVLDGKASAASVDALTVSLSGKADASHTHAIANVTGLQTALDGKASVASVDALVTALNAAVARIATLEANLANAVVYSDGKLHY